MFEFLETRRLLSTTSVVQSGSSLTINGTSGNDTITVTESGHNVHVEYSTGNSGITATNYTGITKININGNNGNDSIFYIGNTVGADIHGDGGQNGKGKNGGSHGSGSGSGGTSGGTGASGTGAGADFITVTDAGTGSSVVDGDGGNDDITSVASNMTGGRTTLYGGDGNDNIYVNTDNGVTYSTAAAKTQIYAEGGKDIITVYDGKNTIDGGGGKDVLITTVDAVNVVVNVETTVSTGGT